MLWPTVILGVLAVALVGVGYARGEGQHVRGLKAAWTMSVEMLPLLAFCMIVAGMVPALLPQEWIARWVGAEAGWRGILIGSLAGCCSPGGPYVSLPMVAGLMGAGAGIGTTVAFLTGWSLCSVTRVPMEVGILGWRFTLARLACSFFMPPLAGWLAQTWFKNATT